MHRRAAIVGIGRTEYSRNSGRSTLALARECATAAVEDAGLCVSDIDAMVTFQANDSVSTGALADSLGLDGLYYGSDIFGGLGSAKGEAMIGLGSTFIETFRAIQRFTEDCTDCIPDLQ